MACSRSICVKEMVGPKGDHCLAGYLATYSQKMNSHLCDRLEAPYEDNLRERKSKKRSSCFTHYYYRKMLRGETRDLRQTLREPICGHNPMVLHQQDGSPATGLDSSFFHPR